MASFAPPRQSHRARAVAPPNQGSPLMLRFMLMLAISAAAGCLFPGRAAAHAILLDSEPAARATVPPGPTEIRLRFNSRIDHVRSRLALRNGQAERVLTLDPASPADVMAATSDLAPGNCVLRWQVLAVDGHITRGEVPLTVQAQFGQAQSGQAQSLQAK